MEPIKCMRLATHRYRWRGEEDIEPIKWMRSPPTQAYRWSGERVIEPIQVDALATHQLQVERRRDRVIEPIKWMLLTTPPATGGEEKAVHRSQSSVCARHTPATGGEERES